MDKKQDIKRTLDQISSAIHENDWTEFNRRLSEKRQSWYNTVGRNVMVTGSDVRRAYRLFLIEYLGLNPDEVPVVYEDETRIVWHSYNWCPVPMACHLGGYDTREVCRRGYEESVQEFVKLINPDLRFTRDYDKIRPYAEYCEEEFYLEQNYSSG